MKKLRRDGVFGLCTEVEVDAEFLNVRPAYVAVCFLCILFCFNKWHFKFFLVITSPICQDHINRYNFTDFLKLISPQNYLSANEIQQ